MRHDDNTRLYLGELDDTPPSPLPSEPVDWSILTVMLPWLVQAMVWLVWFFFLLIPTAYGLHGTDHYPLENNLIFVLTGGVLALASSTAWQLNHLIRSTLFAGVMGLLCFWF